MIQRAWLTFSILDIEAIGQQLYTWPMAFLACLLIGRAMDKHGRMCWSLAMTEHGAGFTMRWRWSREFQEDNPWALPNMHAWMPSYT